MKKIEVLLADDHKVVRDGLRVLLERSHGIEVVGDTGKGEEAIALCKLLHPDVVIMDILMPGISGIEAARRILHHHPDTAVIILSMQASREYIYRALNAGCLGYVLKESAGSEVIDAVRQVAQNKRYLSTTITDVVVDDFLASGSSEESPLSMLSDRELEVVKLVIEGNTSAQIGVHLTISPKTVDTYRRRAMQKLKVDDLPALVRFHDETQPGELLEDLPLLRIPCKCNPTQTV